MAILKRDIYIDSLKFALVVFVILGHTLEKFGSIETSRWSLATYFTIYTFHMPLFVFVSGLFSSRDNTKTVKSILKYLETFLIFQFVWLLLGGDWSWGNIITPQWTLWYLLSLCFWKIGIMFIPYELSLSRKIYIVTLFIIISFCMAFVPIERELSFQRTFSFFPFFLIGYYAKDTGMIKYIRNKKHYLPMFLVFTIFIGIFINNKPLYSLLMFQSISVNHLLGQMVCKTLSIVVCLLMSVSVINIMPTFNMRFAKYGQCTLLFYIGHTFLIHILKKLQVSMCDGGGYLSSIVYAILITIILMLISKIKGIDKLLTPITSMIQMFRTK